jgi:hypothetical protein
MTPFRLESQLPYTIEENIIKITAKDNMPKKP